LKALLGRDKEGKNNINYSKNSAGLNLGKTYQKKYKVNLNFVYTQDDKNSVDIDSTLTPVKNYLVGSNGKLKFSKALTVDYEFVWSYFNDNTKADSNIVYDNAINVKTSYKFKKSLTFLDYYRVGPDFNTMNGIATVDREKYTLGYTNKMKLLSLTTTSKYQKDNLENQEDKTNYLLEYNMNSSCNPLKSLKNLNFKKLMLSADLSYRRNYNELKNNPLSRDNDLRNWVYKLKVSNSMFKNAYSYYFSYEYEDENDKINFENTYTTNFEFYNGYKKKLLKLLNLDIKSKFRFKKVDEKIDRYLNGNFSLKYSKKKFSCLVDYYYDFNFSSTEDQDSKKQKLAFEVKYSHKKKKITNEYNLKVDYNFNKFENEENDYNKLLITTGLKVMF
jgi:hypothetical protein